MAIAEESRSARFIRNAGWSISGQVGLLVLGFVLIPFLIRRLGSEGYAVYSLMGGLSGYLALFALGAGTVTVKFVSELLGANSHEDLEGILGLSFWMHAGLVGLGALILLFFRQTLVDRVFHVSPPLRPQAYFVFTCSILAAAFFALIQFCVAACQGLQRYDMASFLTLAQSAVVLGGSALLLKSAYGLEAIGRLYLATQFILCLAGLAVVMRLLPLKPLRALSRPCPKPVRKRFFSYIFASAAGYLSWSIVYQGDRVFIGHLRPLSELTYYLMPAIILQKFLPIPITISSSVFPILSELHGRKEHASMARVYKKCSQLVLWLALPGFVLLLILAPQILTLWLGGTFSLRGTWPLRFLCLGYLVYFMSMMPSAAYFASSNVRYSLISNLLLAGLCCLSWWLLIPRMGILGAAIGFFAAYALTHLPLIYLVNREVFGISPASFLKEICLKPFAAAFVLFFGLWLIRVRLFSWGMLVFVTAVSGSAYYALGLWMMDAEDKERLRHLAGRFGLSWAAFSRKPGRHP